VVRLIPAAAALRGSLVMVQWWVGVRANLHQTETHTTSDGVLFALRHVERPDDDPGEDGKEEVD
jgi:hypothetical protein